MYFGFRKVVAFYLLLIVLATVIDFCASSESRGEKTTEQIVSTGVSRRMLLEAPQDLLEQPLKKKSLSLSAKNQTKLIKSSLYLKNQTKPIKSNNLSTKNQTKLVKASFDSTKLASAAIQTEKHNSTLKIKKLNSTSTSKSKPSNTTKTTSSVLTKKTSDLFKTSSDKNKTTKATATKQSKLDRDQNNSEIESEKESRDQKAEKKTSQQKPKKKAQPSWIEQDDEDDFVSELRDLPTQFHRSLLPDLEKISTTSKAYLTKANKQMTNNFKPFVGNKYAPTIATGVSCAFILIPLLLVSLLFNKIKAYFSIQKLLIFIQIYLSIYFSILCLSAVITGLEPLKFFFATSQSTYIWLQVLQTLGYVLYLLLLLMYLILVFSTDCGTGPRFLGLGQTFVGFAVGLHYYVTVFHRVVSRQSPKTNWKVHGIYAMCFLVVCLFATAERRKKAYMEDGGEEGKKS